ncbi:MAG: hypothetical protein JRN26_01780 [Nitrososphaerota archaeon]|jgi:flagellin-like protein|nr:hypothetical protein [Nitrososphaerota archaeon]MDG6935607.1 hypothetical protein [Nitrososphaerota archaeon]MDG6944884.1 hypothetical protein [Nitrososphaerota archaeon]
MRKAVSDVVAAVILIMIVVTVFGGIVYPLLVHYQSFSDSLVSSQQKQSMQSQVLLTPVYSYEAQSGSQTEFYLYFYNYGKYPFTPSEFIVSMPNAGEYAITSFSLTNPQSGSSVSGFNPSTVTEVTFSMPYTNAVSSYYNITAVGNGMTLSWQI